MMQSSRRSLALALMIGGCVTTAGCLGSDEPERATEPSRVDSAARFEGERAEVAELLERWERAVLAEDVGVICRQLFAIEENHGFDDDNGGVRYCELDDANSPTEILGAAGGAEDYDVVAHAIVLEDGDGPRLAAQARISAGASIEIVTLRTSDAGDWRIVARSFPDAWGKSGGESCKLATQKIASTVAPLRPADGPREAALQGVFADQARSVLRRGGAFELARITYRPDYAHVYALRNGEGQLLKAYPVGVWGPRSYDASSVYFCRGRHLAGYIV
jgi:hypothetical protein